MDVDDLADDIEAARLDHDEFEQRAREDASALKDALGNGIFDNPQPLIGLEYELYAVDASDCSLVRIPRSLLALIGFERELGLHNAEMNTSPHPLNQHGLTCQAAEVKSRLTAAQSETHAESIYLVSDGMWTISPTGEAAVAYLDDAIEVDDFVIATNVSNAIRYHVMSNYESASLQRTIETPNVTLSGETVGIESITTSIQPHFQVSDTTAFPRLFRYALRIAGPVLALGVNAPFFPPELYDDVDPWSVIETHWMENRIPIFEGVFNSADDTPDKVRFPRDFDSTDAAVEAILGDPPVLPIKVEAENRFDDQWRYLSHKRGTYWRWIRPVFDAPTRAKANLRIEFRPLPAQPTVRDSVAFLALYAGLLEGLAAHSHPLERLEWSDARQNFYEAMRHGLEGDFTWITAEGEETTDRDVIFDELFDFARNGLQQQGLSRTEADTYLRPLLGRWRRGLTPARWKTTGVAARLTAGTSLQEAIESVQREYIESQQGTLLSGTFLDWLDRIPSAA